MYTHFPDILGDFLDPPEDDGAIGIPPCFLALYEEARSCPRSTNNMPPGLELPDSSKICAIDAIHYQGDETGMDGHVDQECFPQGGVVALYVHSEAFEAPRRVIAFYDSWDEFLFSCVLCCGSMYYMGPRFFAQEEARRIKHKPTMVTEGECWVILFRLRK